GISRRRRHPRRRNMTAEQRLVDLGIDLPDPPPAVGTYVSSVIHGDLLFVSGHGPYSDGSYIHLGKVDSVVSVTEAREAARLTVINALGSARAALGSLDRVTRVIRLFGMVNSDPDFQMQPR